VSVKSSSHIYSNKNDTDVWVVVVVTAYIEI